MPIALLVFVVCTFTAFATRGPRTGGLLAFFGGWMFLPVFEKVLNFHLFSAKSLFVPAVILAAALVFDPARWLRVRPRLVDVPILVCTLVPFATSLSNGLGAYDGFRTALDLFVSWGIPYVFARLYLTRRSDLLELATLFATSALVYAPLCLWEVRMSPQLHYTVYGFQAFSFDQAVRFGGYRPAVFMSHGLMLALFMACGALAAYWLWRTRTVDRILGIRAGWAVALLLATNVLCKSIGALALLAAGIAVLEGSSRLRTSILIVVLSLAPAAYATARVAGWTGTSVTTWIAENVSADRARSLAFRMKNEDLLIARALDRSWLGWGGWNRSRVFDEEGYDLTITDGLWVITLGTRGLIGLLSLALVLALPALLLVRAFPPRTWDRAGIAPVAAVAVIPLLFAFDSVFNAMVSPLYPLACGAVTSFLRAYEAARRREPAPGSALRRRLYTGAGSHAS